METSKYKYDASNPRAYVVYRCINNGIEYSKTDSHHAKSNIALRLKEEIMENNRVLEDRKEKYQRLKASNIHIIFEPTETKEHGEKVQEIRDAKNLEERKRPLGQENTLMLEYYDGNPIEEASLDKIEEIVKSCSKEKSYLKLQLTFHADLFHDRNKKIDEHKIRLVASRIREGALSSGINYAEVKLNGCNSSSISEIFFEELNEKQEQKTKFSVKDCPGLLLAEIYGGFMADHNYHEIENDPAVLPLQEGECTEYEKLSPKTQNIIDNLIQNNLRSDKNEKKHRTIPVLLDKYAIINSRSDRQPWASHKTRLFCGGHKVMFDPIKSDIFLISEKNRLEWGRIGDKINPEESFEKYLAERQNQEAEEPKVENQEIKENRIKKVPGFMAPTTSSLLKAGRIDDAIKSNPRFAAAKQLAEEKNKISSTH